MNDSYYSYLLSKPVIEKFYDQIVGIVFTTKIKESQSKIRSIFQKTHWRYFVYRATVELLNRLNILRGYNSVRAFATKHNLKIISTPNVATCEELQLLLPADLGLAFNYDQIFKEKLLSSFTLGVINIHASRLPQDRGISPVLWAFARGDHSIWSTIYRIDEGIDSGPIFRQFEIPVEKEDTACSLYKRVCSQSGEELAFVVEGIQKGEEHPQVQAEDVNAKTWSWPDQLHRRMMVTSKRKFINLFDIMGMLGRNT